jgi:hypothetical protein
MSTVTLLHALGTSAPGRQQKASHALAGLSASVYGERKSSDKPDIEEWFLSQAESEVFRTKNSSLTARGHAAAESKI